jgi:hypothetical protein
MLRFVAVPLNACAFEHAFSALFECARFESKDSLDKKGLGIMPVFEERGTKLTTMVKSKRWCLKAKTSKITKIQSLTSWRGSSRGVEARDNRWLHVRAVLQGQPHPTRSQDAQDQKAPGIRHLD